MFFPVIFVALVVSYVTNNRINKKIIEYNKKKVFSTDLYEIFFILPLKKCKVKEGIKECVLKCFEILRFHTPKKRMQLK